MSNSRPFCRTPEGEPAGTPAITLASGSPRRRELLSRMGLQYALAVPAVPEEPSTGEQPADVALRLSLVKALAVAAERPADIVIAADTIVVIDETILGKPVDADDAVRMLRRLRNRPHVVYSGLTIVQEDAGVRCQQLAATAVIMANYSDAAIADYVASGDPLDKAGAYAIQAAAFDPVSRYEGCYANVVGLPMCHLYRGLQALRVPVPVYPLRSCPRAVSDGCPWARDILSTPLALTRPAGCAAS